MTTPPRRATAIETDQETAQGVAKLRAAFSDGAQPFSAYGVRCFWQPYLGLGVCIFRYREPTNRWWIGFGRSQVRFKDNLVVEINPPTGGIRRDFQGVVAEEKGKQWLLHRGRMQLPGKRISESESLAISEHPTAEVSFSDNSVATCFVVACLDDNPALIRNAVAEFVRECQRIRDHYSWGAEAANEEVAIELAEAADEDEGNPESEGTYVTPPRSALTVKRRHATVWKTLRQALGKAGVRSTNKRVGRFGPDLRTLRPGRILFEIKTTVYAAEVQQALGQLLLYEQTLGAAHSKVLVLPRGLSKPMRDAIKALDIRVVEYRWTGNSAILDKQALDKVLAARFSGT